MKTIYQFKPWARLGGDAQAVGEAIEGLRAARGTVGAADVVEAAQPEESVLHRYFTWDDTLAAKAHREAEAAKLLRSIVVVQAAGVEVKAPVRAFVALREAARDAVEAGEDEETIGSYTSIASAVRIVRYREQMMRDALRDLDAYRLRYQLLGDIAGWGAALEQARIELQRVIEAAREAAEAA